MGLFDKIVDTVSQTAREASDGIKSMADKNRLQKELSGLQNELNNRYRDIGIRFFEATKENPYEEYAEMFAAIINLQNAINAKKEEINALEGTVTCPNCGATISKDVKFCSNCGATAPVSPAPAVEPVQNGCSNCGAPLAADAKFCAGCGAKIDAPAAPVTPSNICTGCGQPLDESALFCANCGTKAPNVD